MSEINLKVNERVRRSQDMFWASNPSAEQTEAYDLLIQELNETRKQRHRLLIGLTDIYAASVKAFTEYESQ